MALDVESVVDGGVDRQEPLGGSRRLEPLMFSFASTNRLVGILRPVVRSQSLIVNRSQPFFANGDDVRFELVRGDALRRITLLLQQLSQEPLRRSRAASRLDQEVQNFTLVVSRSPQPASSATDSDDISSRCQRALARGQLRRRLPEIKRPNFRNRRRTVSFDTSMPRSASRSSTSRNDSVNRA